MSTSDLPPLPDRPFDPSPAPSTAGSGSTIYIPPATLDTTESSSRLMDHVHTALVLVAFIACIAIRAFDPTAIDTDLLYLLGGGVLGTAGTAARR